MNDLNQRAWRLSESLAPKVDQLRIRRLDRSDGAQIWDFGNDVSGTLEAGVALSRVCMSNLANVQLVHWPDASVPGTGLGIWVTTDWPYDACLRSQYAGWKLTTGDFFAMGSGPMRAAAGKEELFADQPAEPASRVVGVLETSEVPPDEIIDQIRKACGVDSSALCLMVARTASLAGTVQIVARSVETAMHKLMDLRFDLSSVVSGAGLAPLPPVAKDDLAGIGWTNDAILYGAQVTLWVQGNDDELERIAPQIPSNHSHDYGRPFAQVFANYDYDFYKIDPHLFSPACIRLVNLTSGNVFAAGKPNWDILADSFAKRTDSGLPNSPPRKASDR